MMAGLRSWLLSILSAGVLCALAEALMPPGPVKGIGRMVCGLVLLCAVLSPMTDLDLESGNRWLEDYFAQLEDQKGELEKVVDEEMKSIIEQEYVAYILDKATELGMKCTVRLTCEAWEDGVYVPDSVEITGAMSLENQEHLALALETDLGIPRERQFFVNGEALP